MKLIVAFSGSVATVKCFQLLEELSAAHDVAAVFTEAAWSMMEAAQEYNNSGYEKMYPRLVRTWEKFSDRIPPMPDTHQKSADALATDILVYRSASEWKHYKHVGSDPVLHIELRKWADCVLIAPLSANTLAKLANGLADNLLTCILRAWPIGRKPWLVAPAMNTAMWEHPLTGKHLGVVQQELQGRVVPPKGSSTLACGDTGAGAMATVQDIVQAVQLVEEEHGSASAAQAAATAE